MDEGDLGMRWLDRPRHPEAKAVVTHRTAPTQSRR
jgi:hypothetical protein